MDVTKSIEDPATGQEIELFEEEKIRRYTTEEGDIIEHHLKGDVLHSFGDQAAVRVFSDSDKMLENPSGLYWYNNGVESRDHGKPTMI